MVLQTPPGLVHKFWLPACRKVVCAISLTSVLISGDLPATVTAPARGRTCRLRSPPQCPATLLCEVPFAASAGRRTWPPQARTGLQLSPMEREARRCRPRSLGSSHARQGPAPQRRRPSLGARPASGAARR